MCNDKLVYKLVIWVFWAISLWNEKESSMYMLIYMVELSLL